jgi:hypothetical protein
MLSVMVFVAPQRLAHWGVTEEMGRVLLMQMISLLLLFGGLQMSLGKNWRRFSLMASFVVLAESILVSLLRPGIG